jgi:hypothetical protein
LQPKTAPPAPATVDAVLCVSSEQLCRSFLPPGWQLHLTDGIGYALP